MKVIIYTEHEVETCFQCPYAGHKISESIDAYCKITGLSIIGKGSTTVLNECPFKEQTK